MKAAYRVEMLLPHSKPTTGYATMKESNAVELSGRAEASDPLSALLRSGAQALIQQAVMPNYRPCLGPHGDPVGDEMPQQWIHRVVVHRIRGQIAVLGVPFQQTLLFQKAADPVGDGMHPLGEFLAGRRLDPTEPGCSIGMIDIDAIKEQHVKVDVEVQHTTEALNQGDRAGTGSCMAMACFFDQVHRDHAVDDTQHPAHDLGPAGKQETQLERRTQHPLAHGLLGQHLVDQ